MVILWQPKNKHTFWVSTPPSRHMRSISLLSDVTLKMCAHVGKKANTDEGLYLKMSMDGWRYVNEERQVKALSIRQGNVHVCVCVWYYNIATTQRWSNARKKLSLKQGFNKPCQGDRGWFKFSLVTGRIQITNIILFNNIQ